MSDDISALIGAVKREVRDTEREGKPARIVVATRTYDTALDDLWDALTNAERLPRWFAPVTGDLKLGGRYQVQGNAGGVITRCDKPHHLALTWEFGEGVSWVEVDLSGDGAGARLELRHIAPIDPHWDKFGPGAVGVGWELGLMGLVRHLENPSASRPPEGDPAWGATDEAKRFMSMSAVAWGEADAASGADAVQARESAERTRKFYCGEA
jgi:uncharacterized protein YndB with AHSA1/START domain